MARPSKLDALNWEELFQEQQRTGESIASFCKKRNISTKRFYDKKYYLQKKTHEISSKDSSSFKKVVISHHPQRLISGTFEFKSGTKFHVQDIPIELFKNLKEME